MALFSPHDFYTTLASPCPNLPARGNCRWWKSTSRVSSSCAWLCWFLWGACCRWPLLPWLPLGAEGMISTWEVGQYMTHMTNLVFRTYEKMIKIGWKGNWVGLDRSSSTCNKNIWDFTNVWLRKSCADPMGFLPHFPFGAQRMTSWLNSHFLSVKYHIFCWWNQVLSISPSHITFCRSIRIWNFYC